MSIIRVAQRHRYTVVDRRAVTDQSLSFRARGLLVWLLDKPDDWTIRSDTLSEAATEGREAVRSAMRELQDRGYLVKRAVAPSLGGGSEWVLYEVPPTPEDGSAERPETRLSGAAERPETRTSGNPSAQKPAPITKTDLLPKTERAAPKAQRPQAAVVADAMVKAWWESQHPRPTQNFMGVVKVVQKLMEAGWHPLDVAKALRDAPVATNNTLEFELRRRTKPRPGKIDEGKESIRSVFCAVQ